MPDTTPAFRAALAATRPQTREALVELMRAHPGGPVLDPDWLAAMRWRRGIAAYDQLMDEQQRDLARRRPDHRIRRLEEAAEANTEMIGALFDEVRDMKRGLRRRAA
jgi:hypothetical protein